MATQTPNKCVKRGKKAALLEHGLAQHIPLELDGPRDLVGVGARADLRAVLHGELLPGGEDGRDGRGALLLHLAADLLLRVLVVGRLLQRVHLGVDLGAGGG